MAEPLIHKGRLYVDVGGVYLTSDEFEEIMKRGKKEIQIKRGFWTIKVMKNREDFDVILRVKVDGGEAEDRFTLQEADEIKNMILGLEL